MINIHLISQCTIEPEVDCLILPAFEDAIGEATASSLLLSEDKVTDFALRHSN